MSFIFRCEKAWEDEMPDEVGDEFFKFTTWASGKEVRMDAMMQFIWQWIAHNSRRFSGLPGHETGNDALHQNDWPEGHFESIVDEFCTALTQQGICSKCFGEKLSQIHDQRALQEDKGTLTH